MTNKIIAWTTGSTATVPLDFGSLVSINAIGAASVGAGAFATQPTVSGLSPGAVITIHIGVGGGTQGTKASPGTADTWYKAAATVLYAQGGKSSTGTGGASSACFPTTGAASGGQDIDSGGAGAGGPNGDGLDSQGSAPGGQGDNGFGGLGGGITSQSGRPGGDGTEWGGWGSGGGGGKGQNGNPNPNDQGFPPTGGFSGGAGGNYGGAGGAGGSGASNQYGNAPGGGRGVDAGGVIVMIYIPKVAFSFGVMID